MDTKTLDLNSQERTLMIEALDMKITKLHQELTEVRDLGALYFRSGIRNRPELQYDAGRTRYLSQEIDRNIFLMKKLMENDAT